MYMHFLIIIGSDESSNECDLVFDIDSQRTFYPPPKRLELNNDNGFHSISDYNNDSGMVDEGNATQEENAIQEDNIIQEDNAIQEENAMQEENAIQVENESNDVSSLFEAVFIFIISIITRESKKK